MDALKIIVSKYKPDDEDKVEEAIIDLGFEIKMGCRANHFIETQITDVGELETQITESKCELDGSDDDSLISKIQSALGWEVQIEW